MHILNTTKKRNKKYPVPLETGYFLPHHLPNSLLQLLNSSSAHSTRKSSKSHLLFHSSDSYFLRMQTHQLFLLITLSAFLRSH